MLAEGVVCTSPALYVQSECNDHPAARLPLVWMSDADGSEWLSLVRLKPQYKITSQASDGLQLYLLHMHGYSFLLYYSEHYKASRLEIPNSKEKKAQGTVKCFRKRLKCFFYFLLKPPEILQSLLGTSTGAPLR